MPFCLRVATIALTALVLPAMAQAQLFNLTKEELVELTPGNPYERFPDGRPRIPDAQLERARGLSAEDIFGTLPREGFRNQFEGGFQLVQPGTKLVGRAFTVQFMPMRPDVAGVIADKAEKAGLPRPSNQSAIDQLQPGDVLVVDLFGKEEGGTVVGDNLYYYVMKATDSAGVVIDGAVRDMEGLVNIPMPGYFRHMHPTPISNVMLTGVNVPVRIGGVTVMPGDLVVGDREGVYFVPPALVDAVLDRADEIHIHDEWTKKKFDEGKYKSSDIYGSPKDPALKKEYEEYLKKRLAEIRESNQ
jgi:4-hydroxy-4-methyl-2-oxoglutarate aldolase